MESIPATVEQVRSADPNVYFKLDSDPALEGWADLSVEGHGNFPL